MDTQAKYNSLKDILREMGEVTVAFSGGVDSSFLLKVSFDVLGHKAVGVIAVSPSLPGREYEKALEVAGHIGIRLITIETREFDNPEYLNNPVDRCYFCKSELFTRINEIAEDSRFRNVVDGSNLDDTADYRPGMKAKDEKKIRSPLKEAELTKEDIRLLSKKLGLPTWNKDELACLSSRFPYGEQITVKKIRMVEQAENHLSDIGFNNIRARHTGSTVRLEVDPGQLEKLLDPSLRDSIVKRLKEIGYKYVTLDLEGYRRGSLNAALGHTQVRKNINGEQIKVIK